MRAFVIPLLLVSLEANPQWKNPAFQEQRIEQPEKYGYKSTGGPPLYSKLCGKYFIYSDTKEVPELKHLPRNEALAYLIEPADRQSSEASTIQIIAGPIQMFSIIIDDQKSVPTGQTTPKGEQVLRMPQSIYNESPCLKGLPLNKHFI